MPAKRELLMRPNKRLSRWRLNDRLGQSKRNVESAVIQVVGELPERECIQCREGHGSWGLCVVVKGDVEVAKCGNCDISKFVNPCMHDDAGMRAYDEQLREHFMKYGQVKTEPYTRYRRNGY
ncbi:hypothetical protein N7520_002287 [Penicillium odoratum]|uniref:uncharacterized protein n=1 Tax=Penicillium odoratum TaxID=1167516 RepID=UPI0025494B1A|nr:uncharacterized protein N7520_002287 [Penicillium odoratum]KAJ5771758.1 hypothetical protein N7520_002287 [Penicillium odoratum]